MARFPGHRTWRSRGAPRAPQPTAPVTRWASHRGGWHPWRHERSDRVLPSAADQRRSGCSPGAGRGGRDLVRGGSKRELNLARTADRKVPEVLRSHRRFRPSIGELARTGAVAEHRPARTICPGADSFGGAERSGEPCASTRRFTAWAPPDRCEHRGPRRRTLMLIMRPRPCSQHPQRCRSCCALRLPFRCLMPGRAYFSARGRGLTVF
jgi:hypothetical protein